MDKRARAWSIVALGVLCAVLSYVLLRTPPEVKHPGAPPHQARHVPSAPVPPPVSHEPELDPEMYRGWPLFLGWPLPEVPTDWGTGGSGPAPTGPAPSSRPPLRPPEQQ